MTVNGVPDLYDVLVVGQLDRLARNAHPLFALVAHHWTMVSVGLQQLPGVILHKGGGESGEERARHSGC